MGALDPTSDLPVCDAGFPYVAVVQGEEGNCALASGKAEKSGDGCAVAGGVDGEAGFLGPHTLSSRLPFLQDFAFPSMFV